MFTVGRDIKRSRASRQLTSWTQCSTPRSFFASVSLEQRGEKRCFRTFLIYGAAAHDDFSEAGFINQSRFEWRRRPFGGIGLFHVIHVVKAKGARSAGIQRGEDAGLAVGGDFRR